MLVTKRSRSLLCTKWLKLGRKKKNHSQEIQHASQKYNVLSTEEFGWAFYYYVVSSTKIYVSKFVAGQIFS